MSLLLTALVVISAILMVGVILLQQGKGAELGAAFGRGAQGGLFGSTGSANFLTRTTKWLAVAFLGSALTLSLFVSDSSREGVLDELREGQSESVLIEEGAEPEDGSGSGRRGRFNRRRRRRTGGGDSDRRGRRGRRANRRSANAGLKGNGGPGRQEIKGRCGGIGRHAVLRGQWANTRASSNLAIGTIFPGGGGRREMQQ